MESQEVEMREERQTWPVLKSIPSPSGIKPPQKLKTSQDIHMPDKGSH